MKAIRRSLLFSVFSALSFFITLSFFSSPAFSKSLDCSILLTTDPEKIQNSMVSRLHAVAERLSLFSRISDGVAALEPETSQINMIVKSEVATGKAVIWLQHRFERAHNATGLLWSSSRWFFDVVPEVAYNGEVVSVLELNESLTIERIEDQWHVAQHDAVSYLKSLGMSYEQLKGGRTVAIVSGRYGIVGTVREHADGSITPRILPEYMGTSIGARFEDQLSRRIQLLKLSVRGR